MDEDVWTGPKWEYWSGVLLANALHARLYQARWAGASEERAELVRQEKADWRAPDFVAEALMPVLNERGAHGWDLVTLVPVDIGPEESEGSPTTAGRSWDHAYLCVMKRPLQV